MPVPWLRSSHRCWLYGVGGTVKLQLRWKQSALAQQLQRALRSSASITPAMCAAPFTASMTPAPSRGGLDRLVTKLAQSCRSPDDTRRISSSDVMPAAAFWSASWCMVVIVRCAVAFSSALERFWKMSLFNSDEEIEPIVQQRQSGPGSRYCVPVASAVGIQWSLDFPSAECLDLFAHRRGAGGCLNTANGTNLSHEPLRQNSFERRRNQKWLDAHVNQPRHRASGVVGVESA